MTAIRRALCCALLALACAPPGARAVVTGQIFGPGSQTFPIAVPPLKNLGGDADGALGKQFARVLSRDLDLSGYFKVLDPRTFIEDPQASGITATDIDFVGWSSIGAQELVKGGVLVEGDRVTIEARLFDVPARRDVPEVGKRVTGGRADVARMAHRFADQLLEVLTGERGPFDTQIVFTSTRGGRGLLKELYLWTFDRDDPVRLTNERTLMVAPRWRPDNRAVLFTSWKEHFPRLFQLDLGTKSVGRLVPGGGSMQSGAWSPDGSRLLVAREVDGNTDIFLLDRSGAVVKQLTDHWAVDVSPTWSPDGRQFAWCSSRAGAPQIYVANLDGSGVRRVSTIGNYNTSPAWSPKGDRIAYATRAGGGFQIVVGGADGSGGKTVTSAGSNEDPSWAPDGRYLIFSSTRGGAHHLALTDRDGRVQRELTRGTADDSSPAWSARLEW
jgi:TolB protein